MNTCDSGIMCPACGEGSRYLTDWKFSGLNDSVFNYDAKFHECPKCGLAFIANITDERLAEFYEKECAYFDSPHFDITAPENISKFEHYKEILQSAGLSGTPVTDIGCGRGGFLLWLRNNGWQADCLGVDIDLKSIPLDIADNLSANAKLSFQEGRAVSLPFDDRSQSLLSYFHVFEHIRDISSVLREAFRVLDDTGHIMIEVPDAERYEEHPIGTAFWFSIREHINHFSLKSISSALHKNGFDIISTSRELLTTPDFTYPSLIIIAKKNINTKALDLSVNNNISLFLKQSKHALKHQAAQVNRFGLCFSQTTFWGCSAQLLSLLPMLSLDKIAICDSSSHKQQCTYKGIPILDPKKVHNNGALIVAPYLHGNTIESAAITLGWPKKSVLRLR